MESNPSHHWGAEQPCKNEALIAVRRRACRSDEEYRGTVALVAAAPDMLARVEFCVQILGDVAMAINHHCDLQNLTVDEWRTWTRTLEHYRSVLEAQQARATDTPDHTYRL